MFLVIFGCYGVLNTYKKGMMPYSCDIIGDIDMA